jgi:hypothetical protein
MKRLRKSDPLNPFFFHNGPTKAVEIQWILWKKLPRTKKKETQLKLSTCEKIALPNSCTFMMCCEFGVWGVYGVRGSFWYREEEGEILLAKRLEFVENLKIYLGKIAQQPLARKK